MSSLRHLLGHRFLAASPCRSNMEGAAFISQSSQVRRTLTRSVSEAGCQEPRSRFGLVSMDFGIRTSDMVPMRRRALGFPLWSAGISGDHWDYLAAGGLDYIIGDGQLRYGSEEIFDVFYAVAITKNIIASFDFQEVNHPAYKRDRGPVSIFALRVHIEIYPYDHFSSAGGGSLPVLAR